MNNRQLKFRAWDKLAKKFTYPDKGYQGHYVLTLNGQFHNLQNGSGGDEYVVQQWTGFVDRNGKDVYEGDIFSQEFDPIIFLDGKFMTNLRGARLFDLEEFWEDGQEPEVIGNVFENSELLKMNRIPNYRVWHKIEKRFVDLRAIDFEKETIDYDCHGEANYYDGAKFDEIVFQQYTGLKDKNGKEIYDGDIICLFNGKNYTVRFIEENNETEMSGYFFSSFGCEVIGNVFESKELLNDEN